MKTVYDFTVKDRQGNDVSLSQYQGKVLLIVNTATGCGFTPHYEPLEAMYKEMRDQGFEILDFPCNQFANQAPGSEDEIHEFCTLKFGTEFPQFKKIDVNGETADPLFAFLAAEKPFKGFGKGLKNAALNKFADMNNKKYGDKTYIGWNFTKFLIDREGKVVARFEPTVDMQEVKKAVAALGVVGNGSSFGDLYSILRQNIWVDLHPAAIDALTKIADKSLNEIFDVADKADFVELKQLTKIFVKNDKISAALRCEIAEKLLNRSMILAGNSSNSQDLAAFQLEAVSVLAQNKWTRAGGLAKDYFSVAKNAYNAKFLSAEQFTSAISCVELLASRQAVAPLSEYLDQMNKAQEAGNAPDKAVVLAVINALANLGDKSSFDCLLYVTYVRDYPEEVAVAARNALTRLKW